MNAFSSILFQITVMFLLIMSGVFLYRIHWISEETNKQLSKIVISFVNPALMFCAYTIEFKESLLIGLLEAFGVAVITHLLFIAVSKFLLRKKDERYGLERYCLHLFELRLYRDSVSIGGIRLRRGIFM